VELNGGHARRREIHLVRFRAAERLWAAGNPLSIKALENRPPLNELGMR